MRKIIFFDIDGTLTSETDGSIPESCIHSIREARKNGHLMYINTGRCYQNVEPRFREIGFDGYVCGCGTNLYSDDRELFYISQPRTITRELLKVARDTGVDILFESKYEVCFDTSRPLTHPDAIRQYLSFRDVHHYTMRTDLLAPDFTYRYFQCIDRGGTFREFVPIGYSKGTGIARILAHHGILPANSYAVGDSNNDLTMLSAVGNSIAMGNAAPPSLFQKVTYVTDRASCDGIRKALKHFDFI